MLDHLGEFSIRKQLGEGGMGAVYLAYQESLDREVALKVLTERLCKNETFIARFKREARSAASIIHPNVIQIYSIGEENGIHYFAMEYVRGKDLADLMAEGRRFGVEETIDIVMQVAEACDCAAEAGIIHRDIKPANIMLTDRGMVKVTDFGLAKTTSSDLNVTDAGTIVGTANYMSPEQGQGKPLDIRTDIYSLGIVFFELLAGRVPFMADQPSSVLYMHVYEPPPPPSSINRGVPPAVDRMVLRMLAKDVKDRPADAGVLLAELRGLRQSLGTARLRRDQLENKPERMSSPAPSSVIVDTPSNLDDPMRSVPSGALKALIADDVESVRKLYERVLTGLGFSTIEARDGEDATRLWQQEKPDLVLLDINMPKKDGLAVLEEKKARNLEGEVIVISARKDRESVARAASKGVCSYLTKPVNINELRSRIQRVMRTPGGRIAIDRVAPGRQKNTGRQIVIYDAGTHARTLYRGVLESQGHQVVCVASADDVYKIIDDDLPDLLVVTVGGGGVTASLLQTIKSRGLRLPVIAIIEELDLDTRELLCALGLGPVLKKPVRIGDFRQAVEQALSRNEPVDRVTLQSSHFTDVMEKQLAHDHAFTVYDFARELAAVLPQGARRSFEERIESGSTSDVQTAIGNLLRKLRADGRIEIGMRYVRYAYMHGNLRVRNFCLALLPELLGRKEEIEVLMKIITDEDFRVRCRVIERLAELQAEEAAGIVVRFLNDDVWKVRKAAAACLECFDLANVIEHLILFYARSNEPLPDRIRRRLTGGTGAREMDLVEKLARHASPEVRAFIATFMGELGSKLAVRSLLALLRDRDARVRVAAARAAGKVRNDKLRDGLVHALTDRNSEVLSAVVEGLCQYGLQPGASLFLLALADRGRRVSDDAVRFFVALNQRENALADMLDGLQKQDRDNRKFLSLLLQYALPNQNELTEAVKLLNSRDAATRRQGMSMVLSGLREAYRDLSEKLWSKRASRVTGA